MDSINLPHYKTMHVIVVGAGVTGIACTHSLLKHGHTVTLIETASSPNQGCSFGMAGFMGALSVGMLCAPFKGKAGLASIFAKTRRLGWDVSLGHMKFLRQLATSRSADKWAEDHKSLVELARYSVGLTEYQARMEDLSFEQTHGLLRVYTSDIGWEEAHKNEDAFHGGEWLDKDQTLQVESALENAEGLLGCYYMPEELSGNGSYFSKQVQLINVAAPNLTMMYHTSVTALKRGENNAVVGVTTDKGDIDADAVVLSNNLGAQDLLKGVLELPLQTLTGWTLTAPIQLLNSVPFHSLQFENKDLMVTRMGNRLRICGRYWIGDLAHNLSDKIVEELYQTACKVLPQSAVWSECTNWQGQTLIHPDSLPSVGKTSVDGLYLNICHGINGWALANGCAELIAAELSGEKPQLDPTAYSPMRFAK